MAIGFFERAQAQQIVAASRAVASGEMRARQQRDSGVMAVVEAAARSGDGEALERFGTWFGQVERGHRGGRTGGQPRDNSTKGSAIQKSYRTPLRQVFTNSSCPLLLDWTRECRCHDGRRPDDAAAPEAAASMRRRMPGYSRASPTYWAALREPNLWPVNGKREIQPEARDQSGRLTQRAVMLDSLAATQLDAWRPQLEEITGSMLAALPTERPVDLFREFALPWGVSLAMLVLGASAEDRGRLGALGDRVFAATGAGDDDAALRADAAAATAELESQFANAAMPMAEPTFVALSQTLPRLLANCWLALLRHPLELERLRASPRADARRDRGTAALRRNRAPRLSPRHRRCRPRRHTHRGNDLAVLMLASANRDPDVFPDPDRVLLTRPITAHVALGTGRNSCVGREAHPYGGLGGHAPDPGAVRRHRAARGRRLADRVGILLPRVRFRAPRTLLTRFLHSAHF